MPEPTLSVVSFGCRLNAHESDRMEDAARAAGLGDAVVVNTCAVTGEAVRQARQAVRRARRERPDARVIATGCATEIDSTAFAAMPEIDAIIPNRVKTLPETWRALSLGSAAAAEAAPAARRRARAYVEVQNGCDHRCTFCVIPYGRGPSRSVPFAAAVAEVGSRVVEGFREVALTGVDLTSYGADLPSNPSLGELVAAILRGVSGLERLRLSSIDAAEVDPLLEEILVSEPRLMPHLHLSLQSGDDMILKRMKRRHSRSDAIRFCARLRARRDIALGADLIAGFPTETEEMFENTLRLLDECGLAFLHVFPFSPRPGTPAARMPQLPRTVVRRRAARLRAAAARCLDAHLETRVGRTVSALVETPNRGRAECYSVVEFETPRGAEEIGRAVAARVSAHRDGRLLAT